MPRFHLVDVRLLVRVVLVILCNVVILSVGEGIRIEVGCGRYWNRAGLVYWALGYCQVVLAGSLGLHRHCLLLVPQALVNPVIVTHQLFNPPFPLRRNQFQILDLLFQCLDSFVVLRLIGVIRIIHAGWVVHRMELIPDVLK